MRCQVCYEKFARLLRPLPCACQVCSHCLAAWVRERCKSFGVDFRIPCPTPAHNTVLSPTLLQSLLSKQDFRLYEATTFKHLLLNAAYLQCPHCHLISWLGPGLCLSRASCPRCSYTWPTPLSKFLFSITTAKDNVRATVLKECTTSPCPSCSAPIEKNGGCLHMTCAKCKHEYCYLCKRPHHGHNSAGCFLYIRTVLVWGLIMAGCLVLKGIALLPRQLVVVTMEYVLVAIALGVQALGSLLLGLFVWEWKRGRVVRYHCMLLLPFLFLELFCFFVTCFWYPCEACNFLIALAFSLLSISQSLLYIPLS